MTHWNPLAAVPAYPADRFGSLADRIGRILGTRADVVFVQAEAIVALEAVAASVGRPGRSVLVVVTSPYGDVFGRWLEATGADVRYLRTDGLSPVDPEALDTELTSRPADVVYLTHGEAATGIVNPLEPLAATARAHGCLVIVDAVASVGGHTLRVDEWDVDIAVIGGQKAIGGPSSLSAVSVSARAWDTIASEGGSTVDPDAVLGIDTEAQSARVRRAPTTSALSLLALKRDWVDAGRGTLPGMPDPLSFWALDGAVDALLTEGVDASIERHAQASALARSAVRALFGGTGQGPTPETDAAASHLVTLAPVPDGVSTDDLLSAARVIDDTISAAHGSAVERFVRLNHTGSRATREAVATSVFAYATALRALGVPADVSAAADVLGRLRAVD